jgi:hypothetical protein
VASGKHKRRNSQVIRAVSGTIFAAGNSGQWQTRNKESKHSAVTQMSILLTETELQQIHSKRSSLVLEISVTTIIKRRSRTAYKMIQHIAHLRQQCHNSKFVIFQGKRFKGFEVL